MTSRIRESILFLPGAPFSFSIAGTRTVNIANDLQNLLPLVQKPSRYTGGELNLYAKDPESVDIKAALAFPDVYEIGMSHLGIKILYHVINRLDNALADRVFSPWVDMEARMRRRGLPLWGLETGLPLHDFDLVGFSLMHELLYTNVLTILDLGRIPLRSADRADKDPLVIAGGPCSTNPESLAPFIDAFVVGEADEIIVELIDCLSSAKKEELSREETLFRLSGVDGVYIPAFYRPVYSKTGMHLRLEPLRAGIPETIRRQWPLSLKTSFYPERPIVPLTKIIQDRLDIELFRGCTRGCRFCHAGFFYRPVRERELNEVLHQVRSGLKISGWEEFGLLSLSTSDYTNIEALISALKEELIRSRISCSLPSLRADNFSMDLAESVSEIKKTGLTFAPEAGTERLRKVINKEIDRQEILDTARTAFLKGWNLIKCYFMVGLPTECEEDIDGIVDLVLSMREIAKSAGRNKKINVSIGSFVPKPHTPFQWEAFCRPAELQDRISYLKRWLNIKGIKVKWHSVEASKLEAMLSRGDRKMSGVIEEAWRLGCRFDEWTEQLDPKKWKEALRVCGLDEEDLLSGYCEQDALPWDHIDIRVDKSYLLRERRRAFESATTDDCRWGGCSGCGIPGAPGDIVLAKEEPTIRADRLHPREPRSAGQVAVRYRLTLQKDGAVRFVSHLDTIQILLRALRVLDLPVHYTQGLSPRPRLSAGPPLPTGILGKEEIFDVFLARPEERDLSSLFNRVLPEGFSITRAYLVPLASPSPSSLLIWGDYSATLPQSFSPSVDPVDTVASFKNSSFFPIEFMRKGKPRTVNLKRAVARISIVSSSPLTLSFLLRIIDSEGDTCPPFLLLRSLFGLPEEDIAGTIIIRNRLLTKNLCPLPPAPPLSLRIL